MGKVGKVELRKWNKKWGMLRKLLIRTSFVITSKFDWIPNNIRIEKISKGKKMLENLVLVPIWAC